MPICNLRRDSPSKTISLASDALTTCVHMNWMKKLRLAWKKSRYRTRRRRDEVGTELDLRDDGVPWTIGLNVSERAGRAINCFNIESNLERSLHFNRSKCDWWDCSRTLFQIRVNTGMKSSLFYTPHTLIFACAKKAQHFLLSIVLYFWIELLILHIPKGPLIHIPVLTSLYWWTWRWFVVLIKSHISAMFEHYHSTKLPEYQVTTWVVLHCTVR